MTARTLCGIVAGWVAGWVFCSPTFAAPTTAPAKPPRAASPAGAQAAQWLDRAQAGLKDIVDAREQARAGWEIVRLWARGGDEPAAADVAAGLFVRPHRQYLQEVLAGEDARRGQFAAATQAADAIEDEADRANAQVEIIQALGLAGQAKAATELANSLPITVLRTRAYGEIAAAQARTGDFAGARATAATMVEKVGADADKVLAPFVPPGANPKDAAEAAKKAARTDPAVARALADKDAAAVMRNKILAAVAEMQGLAGDPDGAKETAAAITELVLKAMTETAIADNDKEAAFLKAWKALPDSGRWPLPSSDILDPGLRGMLFEALLAALTAKDNTDYERAIANASDITSRVTMSDRRPRMGRGVDRLGHPVGPRVTLPLQPDSTIIERGLAYTFIAVVEAAHKDARGAQSMVARARVTGEADKMNDLFTGTCGPILVALLVKTGDTAGGVDYALAVQRDHPYGEQVARAVGFVLAEQGKWKELDGYLAKLDNAGHRVMACIGAASFFIDTRKK